jgi:hypothetical protein
MNRRKAAKAVRGKPFPKGPCPQRNMNGAKSKDACELTRLMRQAMTDAGLKEKRFHKVADLIWEKAAKGVPFYVEIALEYSLGKPTQPIEHSGEIKAMVIFEMPRPVRTEKQR